VFLSPSRMALSLDLCLALISSRAQIFFSLSATSRSLDPYTSDKIFCSDLRSNLLNCTARADFSLFMAATSLVAHPLVNN
jgi:hypothetical protein